MRIPAPTRLSGLLSGPWLLTGNTAKVRTLCELANRIERSDRPLRILDVGCAGPQPLRFWEPIIERYENFFLVGLDIEGIAQARALARARGWSQVELVEGSGYHLTRLFPEHSFDVLVATQVLEHIARPAAFLREVAAVLKSQGEVFLTLDSAHERGRFPAGDPSRLLRNLAKRAMAIAGYERYYDLPWYDHEVGAFAEQAGLKISEVSYYNLRDLKFLHNHVLPDAEKNAFMELWFALEERLNLSNAMHPMLKRACAGLYVHLRSAHQGHREVTLQTNRHTLAVRDR